MKKIKLGFIPAHREPFNEDWAIKMRNRTIEAISSMEDIEIIVPDKSLTPGGLVRNEEDAKKVIDLFKKSEIEGVIIGTMTFGEELPALTIAEAFSNLPILLFGTKEGPFTSDGNRLSDSFCGTISIASGLNRRKIAFYFSGIYFPEEKDFIDSIKSFMGTTSAVNNFMGARVGMVGTRPAPFETCSIDENTLIERFKIRIIPTTLIEIKSTIEDILDSDSEVKGIVSDVRSNADCSRIKDDALVKLAKLEVALKDFVKRENLSCLAIQCWIAIQIMLGITPCLVLGRITEAGIPTACETDIYGALTMLIQYMSNLKKSPSHFIDWTIQHQENNNTFLAFHCGNAPISLCSPLSKPIVREHFLMEKTIYKDYSCGTCEFQLKEGIVSLNRLTECGGKFKMLISKGKVVNDSRALRGSWSWVEVANLEKLYRTIIEEGFIHHASMIYGDFTKEMLSFCKFTDIKAILV